uniref:Uncharacterized protein n=1 Tax=Anthurium amnicola TaxID=1678845 RepID=A0A1D1Y356_9ARAE
MESFYSNWYKQTVNSGSGIASTVNSTSSLLTPAQVTVSSARDRLVYNIEYKESSMKTNKPNSRSSERRYRESTVSSSSNTFAAANTVAARFQNHERSHSRRHSKRVSTNSTSSNISNLSNLSTVSTLSAETMWDDWLVKYLDTKNDVPVDDAKMEDWIFDI